MSISQFVSVSRVIVVNLINSGIYGTKEVRKTDSIASFLYLQHHIHKLGLSLALGSFFPCTTLSISLGKALGTPINRVVLLTMF